MIDYTKLIFFNSKEYEVISTQLIEKNPETTNAEIIISTENDDNENLSEKNQYSNGKKLIFPDEILSENQTLINSFLITSITSTEMTNLTLSKQEKKNFRQKFLPTNDYITQLPPKQDKY